MILMLVGIYILGILPAIVMLRLMDVDEEAVLIIVIFWPVLIPLLLAATVLVFLARYVSHLADKIVDRIRGRKKPRKGKE